MSETVDRVVPMSNEARAQGIKNRAKNLGLFKDRQIERATERVGRKVPRASIAKVWIGEAGDGIYERLEAALDLLEEEMGAEDSGSPHLLRFTLHNVYGVGEIIAEGPPEDREQIVESLAQLLRDIRNEGGGE